MRHSSEQEGFNFETCTVQCLIFAWSKNVFSHVSEDFLASDYETPRNHVSCTRTRPASGWFFAVWTSLDLAVVLAHMQILHSRMHEQQHQFRREGEQYREPFEESRNTFPVTSSPECQRLIQEANSQAEIRRLHHELAQWRKFSDPESIHG